MVMTRYSFILFPSDGRFVRARARRKFSRVEKPRGSWIAAFAAMAAGG